MVHSRQLESLRRLSRKQAGTQPGPLAAGCGSRVNWQVRPIKSSGAAAQAIKGNATRPVLNTARIRPGLDLPRQQHQAARADRILRPVRRPAQEHGHADGVQACDLDRGPARAVTMPAHDDREATDKSGRHPVFLPVFLPTCREHQVCPLAPMFDRQAVVIERSWSSSISATASPRSAVRLRRWRRRGADIAVSLLLTARSPIPPFLPGAASGRSAALRTSTGADLSSTTRSVRGSAPSANSIVASSITWLILDIFAQRAQSAEADCRWLAQLNTSPRGWFVAGPTWSGNKAVSACADRARRSSRPIGG